MYLLLMALEWFWPFWHCRGCYSGSPLMCQKETWWLVKLFHGIWRFGCLCCMLQNWMFHIYLHLGILKRHFASQLTNKRPASRGRHRFTGYTEWVSARQDLGSTRGRLDSIYGSTTWDCISQSEFSCNRRQRPVLQRHVLMVEYAVFCAAMLTGYRFRSV
jgi:hypothetical protein